jgi:hypothetical protein
VHELRFYAGVHALDGRTATFYVMNTGVNRNGWAVTDEALEQALPTVIGKQLGCGPGYATDRHYAEALTVGVFRGARKPDGYALGSAEIVDDEAWSRLTGGVWGPISVVVTSYLERCSGCGEELTGLGDPFSHGCIAGGGAHLVVESFVFDRADFVDAPAYPQAGLIRGVDAVVPLELLAGVYESQSKMDRGLEPGVRVGSNSREGERKRELEQEQEQRMAELEQGVGELRAQVDELRVGLGEVREAQRGAQGRDAAAKAKYGGAGEGGLEAAMEEARLRLFGRRG